MQANAEAIRQVVQEVLAQLGKAPKSAAAPQDGDWGVFQSVDQAVAAAEIHESRWWGKPLSIVGWKG